MKRRIHRTGYINIIDGLACYQRFAAGRITTSNLNEPLLYLEAVGHNVSQKCISVIGQTCVLDYWIEDNNVMANELIS